MQVGGDDGQQHPMRFIHPAGRRDDIILCHPAHDIRGRHLMLYHSRRIEPHYEFAILGADYLDPVGALDEVQARYQFVIRDVGELGKIAGPRTQAHVDDRKSAGREQDRVNRGVGGQRGSSMRDRRAQALEADLRIGVLAEGNVDFRAAARGRRTDQGHTDDAVSGLLQRAGDRGEHLLGRQIAAICEDRRASKSNFGEHRARDHAREDNAEHACREHRDQRQRRGAPSHFRTPGFCSPVFSPATRTSSPSDNAYPPEVTTASPALTPAVT